MTTLAVLVSPPTVPSKHCASVAEIATLYSPLKFTASISVTAGAVSAEAVPSLDQRGVILPLSPVLGALVAVSHALKVAVKATPYAGITELLCYTAK